MKKHYVILLLNIFLAFSVRSQNLPYLNASTANEYEFPVDKDTNIYMFHGNRLVKTDKNFNTVWANTYGNISFSNLLLSKTGSMYFIGRSGSLKIYFGKINANGSLSWVKNVQTINATLSGSIAATYSVDCRSILLDRNNNLVITGQKNFMAGAYFLKTDTNGNALKFKAFTGGYPDNFSIINDSAGFYKFFGYGGSGPGALGLYTFDDNLDIFTSNINEYPVSPSYYNFSWKLLRSKFSSGFYIKTTASNTSTSYDVNPLTKFTINGQIKWQQFALPNVGFFLISGHMEESNTGDLFVTSSTGNSISSYSSGFLKIDSLGSANAFGTTMLKNYFVYNFSTSNYDIPNHAPRIIHNNNYYFDISGYNFPGNPLTVQKFTSTLNFPCSNTVTLSNPGTLLFYYGAPSVSINVQPVTAYTISASNSTVVSIPFSVNMNFCATVGVAKISNEINDLTLYPNPAQNIVTIKTTNNYVIEEINIFDVNGKKVKTYLNSAAIDISDTPKGMYFISIKTENGIINKKFIKE